MKFDRFEKLIGVENFERVKKFKVLIVGVGGVGGHVVEACARCCIGTIVMIDPDVVDVTNINRQIVALTSTVGKKKVEVLKERILDIHDECNCIAIDDKISEKRIWDLQQLQKDLNISFDFVVDACDDLRAKKQLILECVRGNIPMISCMGTGKRLDPSKLEITTLDKTNYDPIAKILRKFVRDERINVKIPVLVSREEPLKTECSEIASCSFVPASAGLLIASSIIRFIISNK